MTKECSFEEFVAGTPGMANTIAYANEQNRLWCLAEQKRVKRNARRRERDQTMRDLGMVKVRGAPTGH